MTNSNLYHIQQWGTGYFSINADGHIEIKKTADEKGVTLQAIVQAAGNAGLHLPLLIRFTDILHDRVLKIVTAFTESIKEHNYQGTYTLAYPIKVNQEHCVVKALLKNPHHTIALEAGSKPELMAVMGMLNKTPTTIICNGYKDKTYIRAALIAQQMGHKVYIIIEKSSELAIISKEAAALGIKPCIGVRIRLITHGAGKWENSGGPKSKFGLNADQILDIVMHLKKDNALDTLQLIHCHLGSQIANIGDIQHCMQEVVRYYIALRQLNVPIHTVDVGGGLAVDYQGTHTSIDCSMNYSLHEYATNILLALIAACKKANQPQPHIISESGRALTAHHAVLISNITDIEYFQKNTALPLITDTDAPVLHNIWKTYEEIATNSLQETYNYAIRALDEAHAQFIHDVISLEDKAKVEQIFSAICTEVQGILDHRKPDERAIQSMIHERIAAKIYCNLSFFQSLPDAWAIQQIFPIVPITHLNQPLTMHSILEDLTCDSDGTIKAYTGLSSIRNTLILPDFNHQDPYHIGFFLVGAYQEILGNLHNLFGETNALEVKLLENGQFKMNDLVSGDSITNVLNVVHFDTKKLLQSYEKQLNNAGFSEEIIQNYLNTLRGIFSLTTYLEVAR